jgi:glutathione S-transferase
VHALRAERAADRIVVGDRRAHARSLLQPRGDFKSPVLEVRAMATIPDPILYGDAFWISPYVFSCFVALREKGVPFSVVEVSLADGEQRRDAYRARAFTGKVPALVHGDFWLTESSAIVEYLEEAFPTPAHPALLPTNPLARARARQLMSWIRSDLLALREERPTTTMFYAKATTPLSTAGAAAAAALVHVAEAVIPQTSDSLFGTWSIADADLTFMLHRLILNDDPLPAHLRRYAERQWQRPSVQEWVARERRPLRPY